MRIRKYREYFGDYGEYVISNIPGSDLDYITPRGYFEVPPIHMHYATLGGGKKAIDESFYDYCSYYVCRNDERDVEQYGFLSDNLIPILRGELEHWRLAHIKVRSYCTHLFIANLKFNNILFIVVEPGRKKLKLLFETESPSGDIVKHFYNLRRGIPLGRHLYLGQKTQLRTERPDGSFLEFRFSTLKDMFYEWLTGRTCCPVDIVERG